MENYDGFENEIWKTIPEYEEHYEVSSQGRVRSIDHFDKHGRLHKGKVLKSYEGHKGYLKVRLSKEGKTRSFFVHRLVCQAFKIINGGTYEVNHLNGDRTDCRACNLVWCSKSENIQHAYDTGLKQKKLSNDDVNFIRKSYVPRDKVYGAIAFAERFGVSIQQIYNVVSGRSQPTFFDKDTSKAAKNKNKDVI